MRCSSRTSSWPSQAKLHIGVFSGRPSLIGHCFRKFALMRLFTWIHWPTTEMAICRWIVIDILPAFKPFTGKSLPIADSAGLDKNVLVALEEERCKGLSLAFWMDGCLFEELERSKGVVGMAEGCLVDVKNVLERVARRPPMDWGVWRENGARVSGEVLESWIWKGIGILNG